MDPIKNATANEFLSRAAALEAELADTSKALTLDEVQARVKDIQALKQRALAVTEAKEKELEKRVEEGALGGTKPIAGPETRQDDVVDLPDYKEICERVVKVFGGTGRYILARAREGSKYHKPWTAAQQRAVKALEDFQSRVIVGTASDGSGGEFLLPLTQAPDIFVGANIVQPGLFERAPRYPCPGRTVRKALGFDEILAADVETMKQRSRNYARRQLTWMRKIPNLCRVDRGTLPDAQVAASLVRQMPITKDFSC